MKNQNIQNKLAFNKEVVTELNKGQMTNVQGGSTGAICDNIGDILDDMTFTFHRTFTFTR